MKGSLRLLAGLVSFRRNVDDVTVCHNQFCNEVTDACYICMRVIQSGMMPFEFHGVSLAGNRYSYVAMMRFPSNGLMFLSKGSHGERTLALLWL